MTPVKKRSSRTCSYQIERVRYVLKADRRRRDVFGSESVIGGERVRLGAVQASRY